MPASISRREVLPVSLPPRGLSRVEAAAYVGISPSLFDRGIKDRLWPRPFRVYGRVLWDRLKLDAAFAALSDAGQDGEDRWDRAAV